MKKKIFLPVLFFIATIHLISCVDNATEAGNRRIKTLVRDSLPTDSMAFYGLSKNELFTCIARYRTTHWQTINQEAHDHKVLMDREDSRACWYSLDTLKKFISVIEADTKLVNKDPHALGIRFYFAVYPQNAVAPINSGYSSQMTLFMIPTYGDANPEEFDPRRNILLRNAKDDQKVFYLDASTASTANKEAIGIAKNQGELCPPKCPGSTLANPSLLSQIDKDQEMQKVSW